MFFTKNLLFYTLHLFSSQTDSLGQYQMRLATLYSIYNIEYKVINENEKFSSPLFTKEEKLYTEFKNRT